MARRHLAPVSGGAGDDWKYGFMPAPATFEPLD